MRKKKLINSRESDKVSRKKSKVAHVRSHEQAKYNRVQYGFRFSAHVLRANSLVIRCAELC